MKVQWVSWSLVYIFHQQTFNPSSNNSINNTSHQQFPGPNPSRVHWPAQDVVTSFCTEFNLDNYLSLPKEAELLSMSGGEVQPGDLVYLPPCSIIVEKAVGSTNFGLRVACPLTTARSVSMFETYASLSQQQLVGRMLVGCWHLTQTGRTVGQTFPLPISLGNWGVVNLWTGRLASSEPATYYIPKPKHAMKGT